MSEDITIREVKTKKERSLFVDFVNEMYRDVPQFVPAFYGDDMADWDPKKNPAMEYCEARAWLAWRGDRIVGRVGAILSHKANEKWHTNRMRFSQLDFIDDPAVSDALIGTVEAWAREKGCDQVHGPLGFCDLDREGLLVDGFDKRSMFITYYNYPYYVDHLERLGYRKDADWVEYLLPVPAKDSQDYKRLERISQMVMRSGKYRIVSIKSRRQVKPYVHQAFELVNEAYGELYGTVDLNERQITKYVNKFLPLINPDFCCLIVDENDRLAAFAVAAPSMAEAMQRCRGHLFPTGWINVLSALRKNDLIDLFLIAVRPELQNTGLNGVILHYMHESCLRNGIQAAETGPMLETNEKILKQWKMFDPTPRKRRRCFIRDLG
ncbi:MAG: hypothetical protein IJL66_03695 [Lachnospiraceae bacterium]|nr:hypothetical protein [Lachnospiraceae bacterium]